MKKRIVLRYSDDLPAPFLMRRLEKFALADRRALGCRFGEPCDPRKLLKFHDVKRILETFEDYNSWFAHFESQFAKMESECGIQIGWKAEQSQDALL